MAKSKILKELANNEITIEVALSRLMIIASDIDDEVLQNWASKELNGYKEEDDIPSYRLANHSHITYSGVNGSFLVQDNSLPTSAFPEVIEDELCKPSKVWNAIASLQSIVENKQTQSRDITAFAEYVYQKTGIQCSGIRMKYGYAIYSEILSSIRTKLLCVFIELDKRLGNLDDLDVSIENVDLTNLKHSVKTIIYQDNSITIGDKNKIEDSKLIGGDCLNGD
jgi:hypothetical protein